MADQWPDPNGKWMRRLQRWTLPAGIVFAAILAVFAVAKLAGADTGGSWLMLVLDAGVAVMLIVQGVVLRRRAGRGERPR